ncbi:MAG: 23S rRNA (guanosine(2251)-2'-O)-methyltransferase RlmB [Alphaproteobacteria bacterium]
MTNRKPRSRKIHRRTGPSPHGSPWGDSRPPNSGPSNLARAKPRTQELWLYGLHAVTAALANPARRCRRLVATTQALEALRQPLDGNPVSDVTTASRDEVGALVADGAVHQGVALEVSPLAATAFDAVCQPDTAPRLVVLDRVNDPQNLGSVLRAATAFNAGAVIVPDRHAPSESGALAKAASGALELVPLVRVPNLAQALERLKQTGYWCLGLDGAAETTIAQARPAGACALVLGAEGAGLRRLTRERCDALARLPISDKVESLNLATAAAVALYALTVDTAS